MLETMILSIHCSIIMMPEKFKRIGYENVVQWYKLLRYLSYFFLIF
jgi:hypothetical protein